MYIDYRLCKRTHINDILSDNLSSKKYIALKTHNASKIHHVIHPIRLCCSMQTFTLTVYIYEAHLCFHGDGSANSAWDTKVAVSLPNDPMGERHETGRAGKTPNPVWDQVRHVIVLLL